MASGDSSLVDTQPCSAPPTGGLGYSRYYAQRIRDLGKSSKDSWVKRLWNHMFGSSSSSSKKLTVKTDDGKHVSGGCGGGVRRSSDHDPSDRSLPSDTTTHGQTSDNSNAKKPHQTSHSEKHDSVLPAGQRQVQSMHELSGRVMPPQLVNSPYLPTREKVVYYRPVLTAKPGNSTRDGITAAKLRYQRLSKSSTALRASTGSGGDASDDVHKSSSVMIAKRQFKRDSTAIQMEKRAKAVADRAIMVCSP